MAITPQKLFHNIVLTLLLAAATARAEPISMQEEEQALSQIYGDPDMISIATGAQQPVSKAPSVASVITAEDIKAMGATDIDEALETVPGLHVARSKDGYNPIYSFRGISSEFNPQVLMLINGIPITDAYQGNRHGVWGGMPVQAIARIEVVRGPGSAVYGADAFAGVINIITKTRQDINGTEAGGRIGSFDTYDGWALHGGEWAGFDVAAIVEYHDTQGQESIIDADAQTNFDKLFGTHASLAPGPVNLSRQNVDARLDLSREHWRFRGGLQSRGDQGISPGSAQTLDPNGRYASDRWNADLNYDNPDFAKDWDVKAQLSYLDTTQEPETYPTFFPAGAKLPIDPTTGQIGNGPLVTFPDGFIGAPEVYERYARFNTSAFYTGFDRHTLRVGTGFNYSSLYNVSTHKNSGINPATGTANPSPDHDFSVIYVPDGPYIFIHPVDRKNVFAFLQDEWRFVKDWALTAGIRYDNYSDFGNTFNPRTALVWETRYDLTTKLMYGSAFRAPSFLELYSANNPANRGNPNLKPETMDTVELAFDYRPSDKLHMGLNIFNYWWQDIIRFIPDAGAPTVTAQNTGIQTGYGTELEAEWQANDTLKLLGNYSWQKSRDNTANSTPGYAPQHQVYLRANWEFLPNWHLTPQAKWIIGRERSLGDNRPSVDDYTWVDLTLRRQHVSERWEIAFSVRNLFDVDAREPSLAGRTSAAIPNDLPLAGRNFYGEIRVNF